MGLITTVFFPGLGADSTLAKYHRLRNSECHWIEWPGSIPEDWDAFLEILERQIPSGCDLRYVGISFGGLVALKMAECHPPTRGVFLVGSLVDRTEIRILFRWALPLTRWLPTAFFDLRIVPRWAIRYVFGIHEPDHLVDFQAMAARLPPRSVRTLCRLIAHWRLIGISPTGRIHGRYDRILRCGAEANLVEGGHLISMTHAVEINDWLDRT